MRLLHSARAARAADAALGLHLPPQPTAEPAGQAVPVPTSTANGGNKIAPVQEAQSLPALIARAGQRLLDARTSGEVLEAKKLAEAALHYARVTKAANDTHADCLRIITRAEMRMANEIDRGQEAGEVATKGQRANVRGSDISEYEDLGVSRQRVSEWRDLRDAGEEVVEGAIGRALAEGRAPTKSEILKEARAIKGSAAERIEAAADAVAPPGVSARTRTIVRNRLARFRDFVAGAARQCEMLGDFPIPEPLTEALREEALQDIAAAQRSLSAFARRLRAASIVTPAEADHAA
jgi:hypothetical protein